MRFPRPCFLLGLAGLAFRPALLAAAPQWVYVGTYTNYEELPGHRRPPGETSRGLYGFSFDPATGVLSPLGVVAETRNPTYVTFSPSGSFLYAANEIYRFQGQAAGAVSAYAVDRATGRLTFLNQMSSGGTGPCYVRTDHAGRNLLVANFGSGSVAVLPLRADGSLRPASAFIQDAGSGPNPRQKGPHAHSFNISPDDRFAIEAEFGMDRLIVYHFDGGAGTLTPATPPYFATQPGAAPRHFTFHPDGKTAYCLDEIDSTLIVLGYDPATGAFRRLQTLSTLPEDYTGPNTAAEVVVHPSGNFLYASNRGHNSIAVFSVDGEGRLRPLADVPCGGRTPRGFCVDASGRWLLVANQDTSNVVVFAIDPVAGIPVPTGLSAHVRMPVCVQFLPPAP